MTKKFAKGEPLTCFLHTKPITKDVSDVFSSVYEVPFEPYEEYFNDAKKYVPNTPPKENDTLLSFGQKTHWVALRLSEGDIKPTWADYGVSAKLMLTYASTNISINTAGEYRFSLALTGAAVVYVNGNEVYNAASFKRANNDDLHFNAVLNKGDNSLIIMLMSVHIHAVSSFCISINTDCELPIYSLGSTEEQDFQEKYKDHMYLQELPKTDYENRCLFIMSEYDKMLDEKRFNELYKGIYAQIINAQINKAINEARVSTVIDYVNKRYDCSDFAVHGLLRLLLLYKDSNVMDNSLLAKIKQCLLSFKYSELDGGASMMFCRSENHQILFAVSEYLAGTFFAHDTFSQSGQIGEYHRQRSMKIIENWIKEKLEYGFCEWHSNTYYEEDIVALLNLYDFAQDKEIFEMAKKLLNFMCELIATQSSYGILATTHGRCYEKDLINPQGEPLSHFNWLLFGKNKKLASFISIGAVCLVTSGYTAPKSVDKLSDTTPLLTKNKMGKFPGEDGVRCMTYRTKSYMMSAMVESKIGTRGAQVGTGQALLKGEVPVFVTCFENSSPVTRPSYWCGHLEVPKCCAYKNIFAMAYKITGKVGSTHCYFPTNLFDETMFHENWCFGRKDEAFVAVYCQKPFELVNKYELLCKEKEVIWIIEVGDYESCGDFNSFCNKIISSKMHTNGENVVYQSPYSGTINIGFDTECTIDGSPFVDDSYRYPCL